MLSYQTYHTQQTYIPYLPSIKYHHSCHTYRAYHTYHIFQTCQTRQTIHTIHTQHTIPHPHHTTGGEGEDLNMGHPMGGVAGPGAYIYMYILKICLQNESPIIYPQYIFISPLYILSPIYLQNLPNITFIFPR